MPVFGNYGQGCFTSLGVSTKSLSLLVIAGILYVVALLTNHWFTMPPHSYYGLWSVTFCDFLQCQIISAVDEEAPGWYRTLQMLSSLGLILLSSCLVLLLLSLFDKLVPRLLVCHHPSRIAALCIMSVILLWTTLGMFYVNLLLESSALYHPYFSWSSLAACFAGILELYAAFILIHERKSPV